MRWDIFCKVIDNYGDAGVCWRLACGLADAGEAVRLWIDLPALLEWMAPGGHPAVEVRGWHDDARAVGDLAPLPDVLVEAFGCDPAPALVEAFAARAAAEGRPLPWINLEYLSAEPNVERLHGLPSPVFSGPGAGLTKLFFYPGFTAATGGLLREDTLGLRQQRFDRAEWLAAQGIAWHGERLVSLFCYEPPALPGLLDAWSRAPAAGEPPVRLLATAGRATAALDAALASGAGQPGVLAVDPLPFLSQHAFDHLLWACDLNFVRGEDSLVRALWAGAPFVWQIYPQHDDAHHAKLDAFLDWLKAPPSLRLFHHAWNGLHAGTVAAPDSATLAEWRDCVQDARARLMAQTHLVQRLRQRVAQKS